MLLYGLRIVHTKLAKSLYLLHFIIVFINLNNQKKGGFGQTEKKLFFFAYLMFRAQS